MFLFFGVVLKKISCGGVKVVGIKTSKVEKVVKFRRIENYRNYFCRFFF